MDSKNSPSPAGFSPRHRRVAGLWASALVFSHLIAVVAQSLGAASIEIDSKINQCGPISETIEYLLWLLRQL